MVEVEKGSEETGWLRARNLTKEPRADGVTKVGSDGFPASARAQSSLALLLSRSITAYCLSEC